jgi:hypothetical protein
MRVFISVMITTLLMSLTVFAATPAKPITQPYSQAVPVKVVKPTPTPTPAPIKIITQMVKNPKTGKMEMVIVKK